MTSPPDAARLPRAAALPVKDALYGLRHMLRRTRTLVAPGAGARDPVSRLAHGLGAQVEGFARGLAGQAHRDQRHGGGFAALQADAAPELRFAEAAFHGLDIALPRLGAGHLMVSRTLCAAAYLAARRDIHDAGRADAAQAARLTRRLEDFAAVGAPPGLRGTLTAGDADRAALAVFALMLWMLVDRDVPNGSEDELLALCADVADTLSADVLAARGDDARVAALLSAYAATV